MIKFRNVNFMLTILLILSVVSNIISCTGCGKSSRTFFEIHFLIKTIKFRISLKYLKLEEKTISKSPRKTIVELHKTGMNTAEIVRITGYKKMTVYDAVKRYQVTA